MPEFNKEVEDENNPLVYSHTKIESTITQHQYGKLLSQEEEQNQIRENSKTEETGKDLVKDPGKDQIKDRGKDLGRDPGKGLGKDTGKD